MIVLLRADTIRQSRMARLHGQLDAKSNPAIEIDSDSTECVLHADGKPRSNIVLVLGPHRLGQFVESRQVRSFARSEYMRAHVRGYLSHGPHLGKQGLILGSAESEALGVLGTPRSSVS